MKKFKLKELNINNFKGIKSFSLKPEGNHIFINGKNASGKTTLFDAFTWLLFGRDSMNRTQFEIKELDEQGKVVRHGVNHTVEGKFLLDDEEKTFKRVYREEWTKHRGSVKEVFTGHTTDYFVDDAPAKKKEYDDAVKNIISDEVFKLLTNPIHFNEHLDQKKRRKFLLNMIEDVTEQDVVEFSQSKTLENFIEKLNGKDIEKVQEAINSKKKEINKELDTLPVRIDEIELSLPDVTGLNEEKLKQDIEAIDKDIEEKQSIISNIKNGGQISEYKKELSNLDMEITKLRNSHDMESNEKIHQLKARMQEKESNVRILNSKIDSAQDFMKDADHLVNRYNEQLDKLRHQWKEVNSQEFEHNEDCNCPTCGQELPQDQINEAREKAENQFNEQKAEKLESIMQEAKSIQSRIDDSKKQQEKFQNNIEKYTKEIELYTAEIEKNKQAIEEMESNKSDITENPEYVSKLKEKEELETKISNEQESSQDAIIPVQGEISKLQDDKKAIQDDLNKFDKVRSSDDRLKELYEKEKELQSEYEELEHQLFLTEEFNQNKAELLEAKINEKFEIASFKLFEEQLNGGLKETCETLYKGVPYNKGLNNAARINVGLDIINTLNKQYGIEMPIFIDNRESITELTETEAQTINLVVDKNAENLEIKNDLDLTGIDIGTTSASA